MSTIIEYNGTVTVIPGASGDPPGTGDPSGAATPTTDTSSATNTVTVVSGTARQAPITIGVTEIVQQGGTAVQPAIAGGTLDLEYGATVAGPIPFAPDTGGSLFDDSGSILANNLVGFSEGGDFLSFAGQDATSIASVLLNAGFSSASTTLTYSDGSSVDLLGVSRSDSGIFS